jgi:hypothetical protein
VLGTLPWQAVVALFACWYGAEMLLANRMNWPISPRIALLLLVRDLALPALWVAGWSGNTFVWRGNAMDMTGATSPRTPVFSSQRSFADHAAALRLRGARVVRSFRAIGASRRINASRGLRPGSLQRWSWKTGNKTR